MKRALVLLIPCLSEDVERLENPTSVCSGRPSADLYAKNVHHPDKNSSVTSGDSEYSSDISRVSGIGLGIATEKHKEQGFDTRHGFQSYLAHKSANSGSQMQLKHYFANRSSTGVNRSGKKSEEQEYVWDDTNSRATDFGSDDISAKDHWMPDDSERLVSSMESQ